MEFNQKSKTSDLANKDGKERKIKGSEGVGPANCFWRGFVGWWERSHHHRTLRRTRLEHRRSWARSPKALRSHSRARCLHHPEDSRCAVKFLRSIDRKHESKPLSKRKVNNLQFNSKKKKKNPKKIINSIYSIIIIKRIESSNLKWEKTRLVFYLGSWVFFLSSLFEREIK